MTRSATSLPTKWITPAIRDWTLGYCTNVHPGMDCESIIANLDGISADVRRRFRESQNETAVGGSPTRRLAIDTTPLGIGLWLPAQATAELRRNGTEPLRTALQRNHLLPFTINGFPYDNFHQDRVKHAVYEPTWWDDSRLAYTRDLAKVLSELLPEHVMLGSISTLPIAWPRQRDPDHRGMLVDATEEQLHHAGTNLRRLAEDLRMLEDRCGKRIVLAIEPEPGCVLDTSDDVVAWFDRELPDATHRRYLGVCHDVCHAAVMHERQHDVLQRYADAGILLAKVQVSSAIVADWQSIAPEDHAAAMTQMAGFAEDRYLHQTGRLDQHGDFDLADDLIDLIDGEEPLPCTDQRWTTHFHVPVFAESFGHLKTTQADVIETLQAITKLSSPKRTPSPLRFTGHLEVETYAWSVLPESMRRDDLAADVAQELTWLAEKLHVHANP